MLKFAKKSVPHWNNRYLNMPKVIKALHTRQRNGFQLTWEEQVFLDDYYSLYNLYNKREAAE